MVRGSRVGRSAAARCRILPVCSDFLCRRVPSRVVICGRISPFLPTACSIRAVWERGRRTRARNEVVMPSRVYGGRLSPRPHRPPTRRYHDRAVGAARRGLASGRRYDESWPTTSTRSPSAPPDTIHEIRDHPPGHHPGRAVRRRGAVSAARRRLSRPRVDRHHRLLVARPRAGPARDPPRAHPGGRLVIGIRDGSVMERVDPAVFTLRPPDEIAAALGSTGFAGRRSPPPRTAGRT